MSREELLDHLTSTFNYKGADAGSECNTVIGLMMALRRAKGYRSKNALQDGDPVSFRRAGDGA
ncbi:hypothetical protein GCM10008094_13130 [Aidingimonas halophila]|nr:hypothetical protein GCM10008094_13130 [Aidingimonas halophila]